jgi:hypothetical protein
MEEEDHFTQTQLPTLIAAFAAAAMAARLLPLQLSLSLYTLHILTPLFRSLQPSQFTLTKSCLFYRHPWHLLNNGCTWVDTFVNGGCNYH